MTAVDRRRDLAALLREEPSAVLLLVQLAGVLLYPFMDESSVGRAADLS